ncbi:hypothetical protein JXB01_00010 [Candidatus Micrarchaeota archaeon]|nr:hypothetical protein [Candidatus Micrarchaeota archaeon]
MGGAVLRAAALGGRGSCTNKSNISKSPEGSMSRGGKKRGFGKFKIFGETNSLWDRIKDAFRDPKDMIEERKGKIEADVSMRHFVFERYI